MFRRILCVVLGAVTTSLIPVVEPAQALSFRSGGYDGFGSSNSYNLSGNQSSGSTLFYGATSSSLYAQETEDATTSEEVASPLGEALIFTGLAATTVVLIAEILSNDGNGNGNGGSNEDGDTAEEERGETAIDEDEAANSDDNEVPTSVPTPAILPGLIGMGMAAIRKRNLTHAEEA